MAKTPGGKVRQEARPDLQRGDRVAVHEQGIATWTGTVQTVKPSSVSGWWVDVARDADAVWSICLATGTTIEKQPKEEG